MLFFVAREYLVIFQEGVHVFIVRIIKAGKNLIAAAVALAYIKRWHVYRIYGAIEGGHTFKADAHSCLQQPTVAEFGWIANCLLGFGSDREIPETNMSCAKVHPKVGVAQFAVGYMAEGKARLKVPMVINMIPKIGSQDRAIIKMRTADIIDRVPIGCS